MRDYSYIVRDNVGRFAPSAGSAASSVSKAAKSAKAAKNSATVPGGTRTSIPESRMAESQRAGAIGKAAPPSAQERADYAKYYEQKRAKGTAASNTYTKPGSVKVTDLKVGDDVNIQSSNGLLGSSGKITKIATDPVTGDVRIATEYSNRDHILGPGRPKAEITRNPSAPSARRSTAADMKALDSTSNLNAQVRDPDGIRVKGVGGSYAKSKTDSRYKTFSAYEPGDRVTVESPNSRLNDGKIGRVVANETGQNGGGVIVAFDGKDVRTGNYVQRVGNRSETFKPSQLRPESASYDQTRAKMGVPQSEGNAVAHSKAAKAARNSATQPGGTRTSIPSTDAPRRFLTPGQARQQAVGEEIRRRNADRAARKAYEARNADGETIRKSTRMDRDAVNRGFYSW